MAGFKRAVCFLLISSLIEEGFSHPTPEVDTQKVSSSNKDPSKPFHVFIPKLRFPRAEGEEQSGSGGVGDLITTAIKDGIAASSAFDSPTMLVGGFSVMMQPMPNGTEFAGQLMQMAPHYLSMLPALPGSGRK